MPANVMFGNLKHLGNQQISGNESAAALMMITAVKSRQKSLCLSSKMTRFSSLFVFDITYE